MTTNVPVIGGIIKAIRGFHQQGNSPSSSDRIRALDSLAQIKGLNPESDLGMIRGRLRMGESLPEAAQQFVRLSRMNPCGIESVRFLVEGGVASEWRTNRQLTRTDYKLLDRFVSNSTPRSKVVDDYVNLRSIIKDGYTSFRSGEGLRDPNTNLQEFREWFSKAYRNAPPGSDQVAAMKTLSPHMPFRRVAPAVKSIGESLKTGESLPDAANQFVRLLLNNPHQIGRVDNVLSAMAPKMDWDLAAEDFQFLNQYVSESLPRERVTTDYIAFRNAHGADQTYSSIKVARKLFAESYNRAKNNDAKGGA